MDRNHPQRSHSLGVMDATPKALPPGRSLFGCCRPPDSPSTDDSDPKHGDGNVVEQMARRIHSLSTEVTRVEEENIALRSELDDAKNATLRVQERLGSEIESLKTDLLRSKGDNNAKSSEVEGLRKELETVRKSLDEASMRRDRHVAWKDSILAERDSMRKEIIEFSAVKNAMQQEIDSLRNMVEGIVAAKAGEVENLRKGLETEGDENSVATKSTRRETESPWVEIAPTTAPEFPERGNSQQELEGIGSFLFVATSACGELSAENGAMQQRIDTLWSDITEITDAEAAKINNLRLDLELVQELLGRARKNLDACRSRFDELIEDAAPRIDGPAERSQTRNRGMAKMEERLGVVKLGQVKEEEEEWECVNASTTQKARGNGIERSTKGGATEMEAGSTVIQAMREEWSAAKLSTENASDRAVTKKSVAAAADATTEIANRGEARPKKKKKKKLRPWLAPLTNSQFVQEELGDDEGLGYGDIAVAPWGIA